jgi:hypothetical protein
MQGDGFFSRVGQLIKDGAHFQRTQNMGPMQRQQADQAYKSAPVPPPPVTGAGKVRQSQTDKAHRKMTAYTEFVAKHIKTAPGATPQAKMAHVAALWKAHKGKLHGKGAGADDEPIEGGAARKITAPAGGTAEAVQAPKRKRPAMHGGAVSMTPANQIPSSVMRGAGAYQELAALTGGCASCDKAELHGDGINPVRALAGLASTVMPIAGLASMFL